MRKILSKETATVILNLEQERALDPGYPNMVKFTNGLYGHNEITADIRNSSNLEYITGGS